MNNVYAVVLVLVVITSTSSTLCFSSNNAGDQQEIFMVVDDETTFHDAGVGLSKANPVQIGKFLLQDGKVLTLARKSSPNRICISQDQQCGAFHWCCDGLTCDGVIKGKCNLLKGCLKKYAFCGGSDECCSPYKCTAVRISPFLVAECR